MAAAEIFYAEDGEIYIAPAGSNIDGSDDARARYKYSDYVTEISVSGGERDIERIFLFGKTSGQQNQLTRELPQEVFETSVTAVVKDENFNEMVNGTGTTAGGITTVVGAATRPAKDVYFRYDDGTSQLEIKFASAYGVSTEMSSDAEGYLEETTGFKCLAKDFRKKYSADRTVGSVFPYSGQFA